MPHGALCWMFSNHDVERAVSRWSGGRPSGAFARLLMALQLSLRGGACVYQGEELGLPEADVPREAMRDKKSPAAELGLLAEGVNDETILLAMVQRPILVNRPFVATPKGVRLCRPDSATVLDLLERWPEGPFAREDGSLVIDAEGNRAR